MDATSRIVAGWILQERLGSGGFGEVWKARRRHVDVFRALKLVPIASEDAFASWRHEIGRLEALSHPNIVRFYDADIVSEDGPYHDFAWIATELCEHSLADELGRRNDPLLTSAECAGVLDAMLGALAAAHSDGCVHRDIKPANILLHASGSWKLCDFGTARLIPRGESHPRTGVVGTFPYMSPAAHRGRQDYAADLYALGVTVHEALCGTRLHPRPEGMTDSEYVKSVLDTPPVISSRLEPLWQTVVGTLIDGEGVHGGHSASELHEWFRGMYGAIPLPPAAGLITAIPRRPDTTTTEPQATLAAATTRTRRVRPPHQPPRRPPKRRQRGWADTPDDPKHRAGVTALVGGSLAVAGLLLYALVPNPVVIAAILGTVLLVILLLITFS
jgi:serine/threonine protein kinase